MCDGLSQGEDVGFVLTELEMENEVEARSILNNIKFDSRSIAQTARVCLNKSVEWVVQFKCILIEVNT
jgi:hypothetical protein